MSPNTSSTKSGGPFTPYALLGVPAKAAEGIQKTKRLKIIARSESHAQIIENFCNKKPIGIVEDWNKEQLLKLLEVESG